MNITRRDFVHGGTLAALAGAASAAEPDRTRATGLQGQTDADNATAHAWRDDPRRWDEQAAWRDDDEPDLVVVGAEIGRAHV